MSHHPSLPGITRRLFIQRSMLALAAALSPPLLNAATSVIAPDLGTERPALQTLTAEEYRILSVVTDTIIPRGGAFPLGALDVDLAARIDHYLDPEDAALLQGIRGALMFLENQAPALISKDSTFSALPAEERESLLLTLRDAGGDATAVYAALRGLCMFYFYTDEQAWPHIGYDGPLVKRGKPVYPQVRD